MDGHMITQNPTYFCLFIICMYLTTIAGLYFHTNPDSPKIVTPPYQVSQDLPTFPFRHTLYHCLHFRTSSYVQTWLTFKIYVVHLLLKVIHIMDKTHCSTSQAKRFLWKESVEHEARSMKIPIKRLSHATAGS